MKNIKYIVLSILTLGFISCENDPLDELRDRNNNEEVTVVFPDLTAGTADFSNYVALGASFTAGFTDGGLFRAGQENSFPLLLSEQFAMAGGGAFTQPLMDDNTGGILAGGTPATGYRLVFGGAGPVPLDVFLTSQGASVPPITTEAGNNIGSDFNNFGIPGAKSFHLVTPGYAAFNPYYTRIASSPTSTVLQDALAQNPTFFTLSEIGGNDILQYATSGGTGVDQTGNIDPSTYGSNDITDPNVFAQAFSTMVTALTQNGAKGVATTVPDITSLSHFTTVPYNPVPLDAATANALNQGYAAYNGGLQQALAALEGSGLFTAEEVARRTINFFEGEGNAMVIIDESLTDLGAINPAFAGIPQYRQATAEDLFVLPLSSLIPQGFGTQIPLEDRWSLTPEEQTAIANATAAYNATIIAVADANPNLAVADLRAVLEQASVSGYPYDNYTLSTELVFGGLVSLDGIHLTSRGYGLMAREFLVAIDNAFGSNFIESGSTPEASSLPTNYAASLQ
ncbi:G-D-S-L family lipolytic protein [Winogradskyella sp.]|uniref:G-D-S-L family lipolytic protein n=1 Tax=Winogradskyella sp. TaxID=1883156 RepID=UPI003BA8D8E3